MRLAASHLLKSGYITRAIKDVSVATVLEKRYHFSVYPVKNI